MNKGLRKIAFIIGMGILGVSIYWSQDGWNFDIAGNAGYTQEAIYIGWFLAVCVSLLQFVFSSNFKELNMSLIVIGLIAYVYSIWTNFQGITHFQGSDPNTVWAWGLAFLMDATAEPLIAWSLGVSRDGDFLGNIVKTIGSFFNDIFESAKEDKRPAQSSPKPQGGGFAHPKTEMPKFDANRPIFPMNERRSEKSGGKPGKHVDMSRLHSVKPQDTRPNRNFLDE